LNRVSMILDRVIAVSSNGTVDRVMTPW